MQYSDTSTRDGLLQEVERLTNMQAGAITADTTLKQDITVYLNENYWKAVVSILEAQDSWDWDDTTKTDYPIATTPLVANQRDYTFPVSLKILKIKRIDITYDGVNWNQATAIDSGALNFPLGNDDHVDSQFSISNPAYDAKTNSIWVYPRASAAQVTAGASIRLEFFREFDKFATTDTTKVPGIDPAFHRIIAIGAAADYSMAKGLTRKDDLYALFANTKQELNTYYSNKNLDQELSLQTNFNYK